MTTISFAYLKDNILSVTTTTSAVGAAATCTNADVAAAADDNHSSSNNNNNTDNNMNISNVSSKTFNHITVHNVLGESKLLNLNHVITNGTQNGTIIRKIKDFGMFGAVNNTVATTTKTTQSTNSTRKRLLSESKLNNENKQPKQQQLQRNSIQKKTKLRKETSVHHKDKSKNLKLDKARVNNHSKTTTTSIITVAADTPVKSTTTTAAAPAKSTTTTTATITTQALDLALSPLTNTPGSATIPTKPTMQQQQQQKPAGTPGRKGLPLPQAVARRNARERNRVKQVNKGFAALRERIPDEVSEVFEAQGIGRGSAKKLSKVETLRMAVEYIRSLEDLLGFDFPMSKSSSAASSSALASASTSACSSSSGEDSFMIIKDEYDNMLDDEQYDDSLSNYELDDCGNYTDHLANHHYHHHHQQLQLQPQQQPQQQQSGASDGVGIDLNLLPNVSTLNGLQYIRISGTNTYQLLTATDTFVGNASNSSIDDEQFNGLIDANGLSPMSVIKRNANAGQTAANNNVESASNRASANVAYVGDSLSNIECIKFAPLSATTTITRKATILSRSTPGSQSSPTMGSSSLHQQQQKQPSISPALTPISIPPTITATTRTCSHTVSPAATDHVDAVAANKLLLQACDRRFIAMPKTHQHQQQQKQQRQQFFKQENCDRNLIHTTTTLSPTAMQTTLKQLIYEQQQQQHLAMLNQANLSISPPLLLTTTTQPILSMSPGLKAFYEHEHDPNSFYEGVVTLKKEFNDLLLETSTTTGGLSDESMIDTIDWWDAHTPKSDGGVL